MPSKASKTKRGDTVICCDCLASAKLRSSSTRLDLADYSEARFRELSAQIIGCLTDIEIKPTHVIPISARFGDNVTRKSTRMPWYDGPTVIEVLDRFESTPPTFNQPLRLPVQDVYKFDDRRIVAGRIESGILRVGDVLLFSPSNISARVRSIEVLERADLRGGEGRAIGGHHP